MTTLKTERLTLRPLKKEDGPLVTKYASDWDVARMTERIPFPCKLDVANAWIETSSTDIVFAIENEGEFIGSCGLAEKPGRKEIELGYWLVRPWWGRGFATEAARETVRHAFADLGISSLVSGHFEDNPASERVLKKAGFEPIGEKCPRYCEARKEKVMCVGFKISRVRAKELGYLR